MKTLEILEALKAVNFTEEQATTITKIFEDKEVTRDFVAITVGRAKFELIKWIVAGVIINGLVATLLKYAA